MNYFHDEAYLEEEETLEITNRLISEQKIMILTFFLSVGMLMIEMLPQNTTFNFDFMCNTILPKLNKNECVHPKIIYSSDLCSHDFWLYIYTKNKLKGQIHNFPEELLISIRKILTN